MQTLTMFYVSGLLNIFIIIWLWSVFDQRRKKKKFLLERGDSNLKNRRYSEATRNFYALLQMKESQKFHMKYFEALYGNKEYAKAKIEIGKIFKLNREKLYNLDENEESRLHNINTAIWGNEKKFKDYCFIAVDHRKKGRLDAAETYYYLALEELKDIQVHFEYLEMLYINNKKLKAYEEIKNIEKLISSGIYNPSDRDQKILERFNNMRYDEGDERIIVF